MKGLPTNRFIVYPYALWALALFCLAACCAFFAPAAQADRHFDLDLGGLGEIHVNHDAWGHRTFSISDRGGDVITGDRSGFGPRHNEVHVLGNHINVDGGALGNRSYSVNTMTGDRIEGQRNFGDFGHHDNQVDLRGSSRAAEHVFGDGRAPQAGSPLSGSSAGSSAGSSVQKSPFESGAVQSGAGDLPTSEKINKGIDKGLGESGGKPLPEKILP
jgi:hypothetical protein